MQEFADALARYAVPPCSRATYMRDNVLITTEISTDRPFTDGRYLAQRLGLEVCRSLGALIQPPEGQTVENVLDQNSACEHWLDSADTRFHPYEGMGCNSVYLWKFPSGSNYEKPIGFGLFRSWINESFLRQIDASEVTPFEHDQISTLGEKRAGAIRNSHPHLRMGNPTLDAIDPSGREELSMPADEVLLVKPEFAVSYVTQGQKWGPRWVSWHLTRSHLGAQERGIKDFYRDKDLPLGVPQLSQEYFKDIGSIVHRGHLCRSAERSAGHRLYTDVYSNILPQRKRSNSGVWRNFEQTYFDAVESGRWDAYVVAGPIYLPQMDVPLFGKDQQTPAPFPHALFKIVTLVPPGFGASDITGERIRAKEVLIYAVIIPNFPTENDLSSKDREVFYGRAGASASQESETTELDDLQPSEESLNGQRQRLNPLEFLKLPRVWNTELPWFPGDAGRPENLRLYRRSTWSGFQVPVWMIERLTGLRFFGSVGRRFGGGQQDVALADVLHNAMSPVMPSLPKIISSDPNLNKPKEVCEELLARRWVQDATLTPAACQRYSAEAPKSALICESMNHPSICTCMPVNAESRYNIKLFCNRTDPQHPFIDVSEDAISLSCSELHTKMVDGRRVYDYVSGRDCQNYYKRQPLPKDIPCDCESRTRVSC